MPFTFAHPALVLPLLHLPKRWFSVTGFVVGSLAPDFEYFLRMRVKSEFSHTISGLIWFDLPVGLLIAFLFHSVAKKSLLQNLPFLLQARLLVYNQFNWVAYFKAHWPVVILSILLGALSHIFWDAFTHEHGFFVQQIPDLQNVIFITGNLVPVFKLLQHGSTVIGGILLIIVLLKLPANQATINPVSTTYWTTLSIITAAILLTRLLTGLSMHQYGHIVVSVIAAFLFALVITPLLVKRAA